MGLTKDEVSGRGYKIEKKWGCSVFYHKEATSAVYLLESLPGQSDSWSQMFPAIHIIPEGGDGEGEGEGGLG